MRYTSAVGQKFNEDGSVRSFPGNTVICMVDPGSPTQKALVTTREIIRDGLGDVDRKYSYLPEDSYHMTVFDCVCDAIRKPEDWPNGFALDAPLKKVDEYLLRKWAEVGVPEEPFRMVFDRVGITDWTCLMLKPESESEEARIRGFRDELSRVFAIGASRSWHKEYFFHITLAYGIIVPEESDQPVVDATIAKANDYLRKCFGVYRASAPRLGFFNDMFSFTEKRESA